MNRGVQSPGIRVWPLRGTLGLATVAAFWTLNWSLPGLRTHWGFFPLWLGYCLTLDACTYRLRGNSLWSRSRAHYLGLFLVSMPMWWLFELVNRRTQNWVYLGRDAFNDMEYFLWGSLSFSTVIPAVFGTAECVGSLGWIRRLSLSHSFRFDRRTQVGCIVAGGLMLVLTLGVPGYFFPLVWVSLFFILDPVNHMLGYRSLLASASRGEWRPMVALGLGALACGFFWEMWNVYSYPKWTYHIPFVDRFRVFEMPILGYGGYLPFSLEVFALYHFVMGWLFPRNALSYVRPVDDNSLRETGP